MDSLGGKTAVVTGAASGMGRAFAERFARAGMKVVLADVEVPRLDAVARGIEAAGGEAVAIRCDVSKWDEVAALAQASIRRFGRVHVVCNNAGVGGGTDDSLENWHWVLGVNLWGVVHGVRAFLPHLMEHGDGHIVNTASMAGLLTGAVGSPYTVSKFGVLAYSETLYKELQLAGSTVGVSALCPGLVNTDIADSERNRPEALRPRHAAELTPDQEAMREMMRELLRSGMEPAAVADLVHDAILAKRFYIFTTDEFSPMVAARHRAIEEGRNPDAKNPLGT